MTRYAVIVIVVLFALIGLVRYIYYSSYVKPRIAAFELMMRDALSAKDEVRGTGTKAIRLREAMGVDLNSLPPVKFQSKRDGNNDGSGTTDNDSDDNDDERLDHERRSTCLTVGLYLYKDNNYIDCNEYCKTTDGVAFKFVTKPNSTIGSGRVFQSGAYCLPTDAAVCNEHTSIAVYAKNHWRCMPQTRAFFGEGGNKIAACNGTLVDRVAGKVWRDQIDPDLPFVDVDEKIPGTTDYRFVCPNNTTDRLGNVMLANPYDCLQLVRNSCAKKIPFASENIGPNDDWTKCSCGDKAFDHPSLKVCLPNNARQQFFTTDHTLTYGYAMCVEPWSVLSETDIDEYTYVCGIEFDNFYNGNSTTSGAQLSQNIPTYPAITFVKAPIFDRLVPSHYALTEYSVENKATTS